MASRVPWRRSAWEGAQRFLETLKENGDLYQGHYEGWYCVSCEAFKQEKDLVDGLCPNHKKQPQWIREKNYFFRLSKYQQPLLDHYARHPEALEPEVRRNEILNVTRAELVASVHDAYFSVGVDCVVQLLSPSIGLPPRACGSLMPCIRT